MTQTHGRIAIYLDSSNRFLFDIGAHYVPHFNKPAQDPEDRLGIARMIIPATSPEKLRWPHRGTLVFLRPRFMQRFAQTKAAGVWSNNSTRLYSLLESISITDHTQVQVFVEAHAVQAGSTIWRRIYYTGRINPRQGDQTVEALYGDWMGSSGSTLPRWVSLDFVNTDTGTFTDFDTQSSTTTRGTWPA